MTREMSDYAQANDLCGIDGVFSAVQALYWYCVDWHDGQWSTLYRIQCNLAYSPGMSERDCSGDPQAEEIYASLEDKTLDPEDVAEWIRVNYAGETE